MYWAMEINWFFLFFPYHSFEKNPNSVCCVEYGPTENISKYYLHFGETEFSGWFLLCYFERTSVYVNTH